MWYLSRSPQLHSKESENENKHPSKTPTFISATSIFPTSDSGFFDEISLVQVQNKSIFDAPWDWFAYQPSPTQFQAVVIPPTPSSSSLSVKVVYVSPNGKFLCAVTDKNSVRPFANLCMYSPHDHLWDKALKISYDVRNPMVAATAIMDHCLYLAGGYIGSDSCVEPVDYLNSAERLNFETGEWEVLPPMHRERSSAKGVAFQGKFYVIGGREDDRYSAEMYDPQSKEWKYIKYFLPSEFDGYAICSMNKPVVMLLMTWSGLVGIKLWLWKGLSKGSAIGNWGFFGYHPNQVERHKFKHHGIRLVKVGNEMWILPGDESGRDFYVNEGYAWPTFPAPTFMPSAKHSVKQNEHIYAFSVRIRILSWRKVSVYST